MLSHALAAKLLEMPNLPMAVSTNVKGVSVEILSLYVDENDGRHRLVQSAGQARCTPQCKCETCQGVTEAIVLFTD